MKIKRSITVNVGTVRGSKGWSDAQLIVEDGVAYQTVVVARINIRNPGDIGELRRKLSEIETYWRQRLDDATP